MGLLLGIDVGTASSKGVLLRPDGSLVAGVGADHNISWLGGELAGEEVSGFRT